MTNNTKSLKTLKDGELTNDEISFVANLEINKSAKEMSFYTIKNSFEVSDFYGNNYIVTNFNPFGYSVISKINYETIETNPFGEIDFSKVNSNDKLRYIPTLGCFKEVNNTCINVNDSNNTLNKNYKIIEKSKNEYMNIFRNNYYSSINQKRELLNYSSASKNNSDGGGGVGDGQGEDTSINVNEKVVTADVEVPHSWFFKHNKYRFSYSDGGSDGICEYVAFLFMIEYNDLFGCRGYLSYDERSKYMTFVGGDSYIKSIPNLSDAFVSDIFEANNRKETLNTSDLNNLITSFLKDKDVKYTTDSAYWLFGNPQDVINKGRPDMICGELPSLDKRETVIAHNIVAYGYFNKGDYAGKYLTHYGWPGVFSQCIVSRPFLSGYDWSIINNSYHLHNYAFHIEPLYKCGCESD